MELFTVFFLLLLPSVLLGGATSPLLKALLKDQQQPCGISSHPLILWAINLGTVTGSTDVHILKHLSYFFNFCDHFGCVITCDMDFCRKSSFWSSFLKSGVFYFYVSSVLCWCILHPVDTFVDQNVQEQNLALNPHTTIFFQLFCFSWRT